jgi:hypothetical protein
VGLRHTAGVAQLRASRSYFPGRGLQLCVNYRLSDCSACLRNTCKVAVKAANCYVDYELPAADCCVSCKLYCGRRFWGRKLLTAGGRTWAASYELQTAAWGAAELSNGNVDC